MSHAGKLGSFAMSKTECVEVGRVPPLAGFQNPQGAAGIAPVHRPPGQLVDESVFDPALNAIFLAWDVIIPKFASQYWEKFRDNPCQAQTACLSQLRWREIAPRPSDTEEAWKSLDAIVDRQSERLEALLERNKDMEREEPAGWTDRGPCI